MILKVLSLAILLSAAFPSLAQQARNCAPRDTIVSLLAERYGEARQSVGVAANGGLVEVFASDETGTWTLTITTSTGIMCLVASGQAFERVHDVPPPGDAL